MLQQQVRQRNGREVYLEVSIDKLDMQALAFPLDYELGGEARRQRLALVQVLQSAKSALSEGRVTDCQAILDGYWARFLTEHTPLAPLKPAPAVAAEQPAPEEEAVSLKAAGFKLKFK